MSAAKHSQRNRELGRIHCLKKELGLDDDSYRAVLWTVGRVRSAKDLDAHGRQAVIEHLRARQQQPAPDPHRGFDRPRFQRSRRAKASADRIDQVAKIEVQMEDLGVGENYVNGISQRMFGIARWRWCSPAQLGKVIAALWYSQRRKQRGGK